MRIRTIALMSGLALAATGVMASPVSAAEYFGDVPEGTTVTMTYTGCANGGVFSLKLDGNEISNDQVDADPGLFEQYKFDTTGLEPGEYIGSITCIDDGDDAADFNAIFTIVPADPCAPVNTVEVPKGPGRAPHGEPVECEGSGIPDAGSDTTTVLLFGSLAIVAGAGLLIARRRTLA